MNSYLVKSPVKYAGKRHPVGAIVEMLAQHAERALGKGSVELHSPREQTRAINEAIQRDAARIVVGELSIDQAVEQIASQARGSVAASLREALQDAVEVLRERNAQELRDLEETVEAQAKLVVAGTFSIDGAAANVVEKLPSAKIAEVAILMQQKVAQLKQEDAGARQGTSQATLGTVAPTPDRSGRPGEPPAAERKTEQKKKK